MQALPHPQPDQEQRIANSNASAPHAPVLLVRLFEKILKAEAPLGYEDHRGFHFGPEPSQAVLSSRLSRNA
ncbi:MAG TPA: hypothetical protein VEH04_20025 [Verrucomicrobiae bacterium]|nr:hypothetical protein [Verrucomicrobiae bacterium]